MASSTIHHFANAGLPHIRIKIFPTFPWSTASSHWPLNITIGENNKGKLHVFLTRSSVSYLDVQCACPRFPCPSAVLAIWNVMRLLLLASSTYFFSCAVTQASASFALQNTALPDPLLFLFLFSSLLFSYFLFSSLLFSPSLLFSSLLFSSLLFSSLLFSSLLFSSLLFSSLLFPSLLFSSFFFFPFPFVSFPLHWLVPRSFSCHYDLSIRCEHVYKNQSVPLYWLLYGCVEILNTILSRFPHSYWCVQCHFSPRNPVPLMVGHGVLQVSLRLSPVCLYRNGSRPSFSTGLNDEKSPSVWYFCTSEIRDLYGWSSVAGVFFVN